MRMKPNMGRDDRLFRCILGLVLAQVAFAIDGAGRMLGMVGILPLVAGLLGWSPLYAWLGISTIGRLPERNESPRLVDPVASYDAA
jgi:hypothetical protein